jgi:hypothetical protein
MACLIDSILIILILGSNSSHSKLDKEFGECIRLCYQLTCRPQLTADCSEILTWHTIAHEEATLCVRFQCTDHTRKLMCSGKLSFLRAASLNHIGEGVYVVGWELTASAILQRS